MRLRATSDVAEPRHAARWSCAAAATAGSSMQANQRIYRVGGGHITVRTEATLRFTDVGTYFGGSYWKVHQLAELRAAPGRPGRRGRPASSAPAPSSTTACATSSGPGAGRRSPPSRHYPGCNQNPYRDRVTLGTSVGWSDIYPAAYDQQWIDVAGLRGCFAYRMIVDPKELLFESNEDDNARQRLVRLPYRGRRGC